MPSSLGVGSPIAKNLHAGDDELNRDFAYCFTANRERYMALLNAVMLAHQRLHHLCDMPVRMPVHSLARGLLTLDTDKFRQIGGALEALAQCAVIPAAIYDDMQQMRAALTSDNVNQECGLQVRRSHAEGDRTIGRICGRRIVMDDSEDPDPWHKNVDLTPFLGTSLSNTPLHFAAACSSAELVQFLLDHGANKHARNSDGVTPIDVAELRGAHGEHSKWASFAGILELLR
jgi:hypothetical protein